MIKKVDKNRNRQKRHRRVRKKVSGTPERPRLNVFKSNKYIYAQIIDDVNGTTLVASSSLQKPVQEALREAAKEALEREMPEVVVDEEEVIVTDGEIIVEEDETVIREEPAENEIKFSTADKAAAAAVGFDIGQKALEAGITSVVFDRGGYMYTGAVKELADGARKAGLKF